MNDLQGNPVLRIRYGPGSLSFASTGAGGQAQAGHRKQRFMLTSVQGDTILAYCCTKSEAVEELQIYRHSGDFFANFSKAEKGVRFVIISKAGWKIYFQGELGDGILNVTNEHGQLLATTEPCPQRPSTAHPLERLSSTPPLQYYQLRIGPLVDAGLLLCGLLALNWAQPPQQSQGARR